MEVLEQPCILTLVTLEILLESRQSPNRLVKRTVSVSVSTPLTLISIQISSVLFADCSTKFVYYCNLKYSSNFSSLEPRAMVNVREAQLRQNENSGELSTRYFKCIEIKQLSRYMANTVTQNVIVTYQSVR